jgi:hypothetical protein
LSRDIYRKTILRAGLTITRENHLSFYLKRLGFPPGAGRRVAIGGDRARKLSTTQ